MIKIVLLDGKYVAEKIKSEIKRELSYSNKKITLAIVQVGDDPASSVYIKNKIKSCEFVGIGSRVIHLPNTVSEDELLEHIAQLNRDVTVTGILVQLPLPEHIDEYKITSAISVEKDVDGFHELNAGRLFLGKDCIVPCTPLGIIELLKRYQIRIHGKECVVVGRSNIVGKPIAMSLLANNGTVTMCHSKTKDLKAICRRADILVCAIGVPEFFTAEYVKEKAIVIDVGVHRRPDGSLCGDVDIESVAKVATAVTPVPGGIGAMTVAMLMKNCVNLAAIQEREGSVE